MIACITVILTTSTDNLNLNFYPILYQAKAASAIRRRRRRFGKALEERDSLESVILAVL